MIVVAHGERVRILDQAILCSLLIHSVRHDIVYPRAARDAAKEIFHRVASIDIDLHAEHYEPITLSSLGYMNVRTVDSGVLKLIEALRAVRERSKYRTKMIERIIEELAKLRSYLGPFVTTSEVAV